MLGHGRFKTIGSDSINSENMRTESLKLANSMGGTIIDSLATSTVHLNLPETEGEENQVLTNIGNGNTSWRSMKSVVSLTNKGDLLTSDGTTTRSLPLGEDGYILSANSSREMGVEWIPTDSTFEKLLTLDNYLYDLKLNSTPTILSQSMFVNGTYRIKTSGVYQLSEDIVFNPNVGSDHMPTQEQIDGNVYPVAPNGPYHMGFFAAIAIEADNVIIDLNGFTIKQSPAHQLQQRFFSCIELGGSPFIPSQGPSNFGDVVQYCNKVLICNGTLGASSHHGLHGNNACDVVVKDVVFENFEFCSWQMNGCKNVYMNNITVRNNEKNVSVIATYSQARFIRSFLQKIISENGNPSMLIKGVSKTGQEILDELEAAMTVAYDAIVNSTGTITGDALVFENTNVGLDGSFYGGVFNTLGVAVDGFIMNRDTLEGGNRCIWVENLTVDNLASTPHEVIALSAEENVPQYGKILQKGPVGDVFRIIDVTNEDGSYKPNVLANAQLYIAHHGVGSAQRGGTAIDSTVIAWASSADATEIGGTHYFICDADSMAHTMKGNIGLFLSGATDVKVENVTMTNLKNHGELGHVDHHDDDIECVDPNKAYDGNHMRGIAVVSCKNCQIKNASFSGLKSDTGSAIPIDFIGENINIEVNTV